MLLRKEAIDIVTNQVGNDPIVAANGYISRDLYAINDKPSNFYMIGSMGLASSIGLGIAKKIPRKRIFVFDGDGNILMNLGSLTTIGTIKPKNLIHVVFDNGLHESTGGQPTHSTQIQIDCIAKAANYTVFRTNTKRGLERIFKNIKNIAGPILILVKIDKSNYVNRRVGLKPTEIKERFINTLQKIRKWEQ